MGHGNAAQARAVQGLKPLSERQRLLPEDPGLAERQAQASASLPVANTAEASEHHLLSGRGEQPGWTLVFTTPGWSPQAGMGECSRRGEGRMLQEHAGLMDAFTREEG